MTKKTTPEPQTEKPLNPKVTLVYVGPGLVKTGKVGAVFYVLSAEELKEKRLFSDIPEQRFYNSESGLGRPGTIHEFERPTDKETAIFTNTRRYVGFLSNDPRVTEWQAEYDAFFATQELKRQEKKGKTTNLIHRHLAPIKVAYAKMVGHQKAAFLAQVIGYITGRVSPQDERWVADHDEVDHDDDS